MPPHAVLGIDTGGTFTDFVLVSNGVLTVHKLPSTPSDPSLAAGQGATAIGLAPDAIVAHGSTVATNALLERKGARTALVTTHGFEDVLLIGRQARSRLYDLEYHPPEPLVPAELCVAVRERVGAGGEVLVELDEETVRQVVDQVGDLGVDSVAVSLLYSFLHSAHEQRLRKALEALDPAPYVSVSSDVLPEFREFERASTVAVNAYVGPLMSRYLEALRDLLARPVRVMQSSGGSIAVDLARQQPVRTILSGPAGGVIGATHVAAQAGFDQVITFDMGGTSTDVALCPGRVPTATDYAVDGMPIGVPVIDIHTVGAGGGSIAYVDEGGALRVGPESAGAIPGPACYGSGERATVTDANLLLGRMAPDRFLGGRMAIDPSRATAAVEPIATALSSEPEEAALGIVKVANAVMERALRSVSLERGYDPRDFTLVAFGGAGPQHACELAAALGMRNVLVPRHPGVLSALGVAIADVSKDYSRTVMVRDVAGAERVETALRELDSQAVADMAGEGFAESSLVRRRSVDARYLGQSYELPVDWPDASLEHENYSRIASAFHAAHATRFGYADERAGVEIVNVRLQVAVPAAVLETPAEELHPRKPQPDGQVKLRFDDASAEGAVFDRENLRPGDTFAGPALVTQMDATSVVPPGWRAQVDARHNLLLSGDPEEGGR